jgi:hypothetical protein
VNDSRLDLRRWIAGFSLVLVVALLTACDLKVSNPGPVADTFLDDTAAHAAIVYGALRAYNNALGAGQGSDFAVCGAVVSREWYPSGQTGSYSCSVNEFRNLLTPNDATEVDRGQQARWLAEQAVLRIKASRTDAGFNAWPMAALALLYVGYSNRLLGEHVCTTVIDGSAPQPFTIHFARAESAFTQALAIAQAQKNVQYQNAALAGRASVRVWKGDWAGAAADAALVPATFSYAASYNLVDANQYNSVQYATSSTAGHRNFSQYNTFYGDNYDQFKDPRTPYIKYPDIPFKVGLGSLPDLGDGKGAVGAVPYYQQQKYLTPSDPIRLSSGREMMLVVAESKLRAGDWPGALAIINQIRATVGVPARQATTDIQTWTWLKLEKLIELWLEGRAVGERRRWNGEGADTAAPGPLPANLNMTDRFGKNDCWPISLAEATTNPNIAH